MVAGHQRGQEEEKQQYHGEEEEKELLSQVITSQPPSLSERAPRQGKGFSDGPASAAAPAHDKQ